MFGVPIPHGMLILRWLDTPEGQTAIEQETTDFLLSLGLNPGPTDQG